MQLTTKIILGAAALGVTGFLLWPSPASASANKPPPAGASLDLSQVKDVQKGLNGVGYSVGTYGADGLFGPDTAAAVRKFNQDHGGPSSGQITDAFRAKLAVALRAKGYNVTKETGPLLDHMTGPVHGGTLVTGVAGLVSGVVSGVGSLVSGCASNRPYQGGPR